MSEWSALRDYSRSRAILMGTSQYSVLPDLPAALNSLERIAGLLSGPLCGWPLDRMALLVNERGPGNLPDRLITSFEGVTDVALFYYVGHGQIDMANQLCLGLAGSRTEANRRAATSLPFEAVRRAMLDSPAAMKIVILDCCFAGLASLPANSLAASSDDMLDRTAGSGAYTMAASAAYSPAWYDTTPGSVRPQTFFTQYLVDLVEGGIPGQPSELRLHPLFTHLRDRLASDKRPVPVERSVDAAHNFVFAHNAAPPEAQRDLDRELTELSQRLAEAEALRADAEAARDQSRLLGEAREQALRAEIAERTRELDRLQEQARNKPTMPTEEREELDEAIDEARRLLDETTAAHEDATTGAENPEQIGLHVADGEAPRAPEQSEEKDDGPSALPVARRKAAHEVSATGAETPERADLHFAAPAPGTGPPTGRAGHAATSQPPRPADRRSRVRPTVFLTVAAVVAAAVTVTVLELGSGNPPPHPGVSNSPTRPSSSLDVMTPAATFKDPSGNRLNGIALSGDGTELAAWDSNQEFTAGNLFVWDSATHASKGKFNDPGGSAPYAVSFAPAGNSMAVADTANARVYQWNVASHSMLSSLTALTEDAPFSSEAFSPDGGTLAVGDTSFASIYLLKPAQPGKFTTLANPQGVHAIQVSTLEFSPDGKTLAEINLNGTVYLWSMAIRQVTAEITDPGDPIGIISLAFSHDGRTIAIVEGNNQGLPKNAPERTVARLWNIANKSFTDTIAYPGKNPSDVAYDPNGKLIAIGDADGNAYLQNIASDKTAAALPHYSPLDGHWHWLPFGYSGQTSKAIFYNTHGGNGLVFDSTGKSLATYTSSSGTVYVYNIASLDD